MTQSVLITGATSGIGRATAYRFAQNGWRILALGRSKEQLTELAEDLGRAGAAECITIRCDFEGANAIAGSFSCLDRNTFTGLTAVVNSAGLAEAGEAATIGDEDWERVFRVNVTASFAVIRETIPHLAASGGGSVVNVSSIAGRTRSLSLGCHYSASKAALLGMTRHLAAELGHLKIRVNAVAPSQTHTPMLEKALGPEQQARLAATVPLGRLAQPNEQAEVIFFLSSPASSYINGAIIDVNGGLL